MNKKKNLGFTIYEMIISIAILSLIVFMISQVFGRIHGNSQGKLLAVQSQHHSEMFIQYLRDLHESNMYIMTGNDSDCESLNYFIKNKTNVWTFTDEDLKESNFGIRYSNEEDPKDGYIHCHASKHSYWNEIYSGTNSYKQQACLSISVDKSGFFHSIMYWVDNKDSHDVPQSILRSAAINIGAAAGYLDSSGNNIVGLGGWSIPLNAQIFSNSGKCSGTISKNSLFINLDEYLKINQSLAPSGKTGDSTNFLARFEDIEHDKSSQDNKNSLKTNIVLNGNNIIFNNNKGIGLGVTKFTDNKQNDIEVLNGGSIQADWFMPVKRVFKTEPCESSEFGTILTNKGGSREGSLGYLEEYTFLACSYNSALCNNAGNYCYLPYKRQLINYAFYNGGRKSFTCPENLYVEVSHPPLVEKPPPSALGASFESQIRPDKMSYFTCYNGDGSSASGGDRACVPGDPTPVEFRYSGPVTYKDPSSGIVYTLYKTVEPYSEATMAVPYIDRINHSYCNCDNVLISVMKKDKVRYPYKLKEVTCSTRPTLITPSR